MTAGSPTPDAGPQVLDSYLLRSLAVAGYAPSFSHCARCGDEGPHRGSARRPAARCAPTAGCRGPPHPSAGHRGRARRPARRATGTSSGAADPRSLREASGLVAAYLHWHLERGLRSLEYVER